MSKIPIKYSQKWQKQLNQQNIQNSVVNNIQIDELHSEDRMSQTSIQQIQSFTQGVIKFHQMIKQQLLQLLINYKTDKDGSFTKKSIEVFLYDILQLENASIDFIMKQYFYLSNALPNTKIQLDLILKVIFEVQFISVVNNMIIKDKGMQGDHDSSFVHIQKNQLVRVLDQNCFFLKEKPSKMILEQIFNQINQENGNKNHILVFQYKKFMHSHLCQRYNRKVFTPKKNKNASPKYGSNKKYENSIQEVDEQSQTGKSNENHISKQSLDNFKTNNNYHPKIYYKNNERSALEQKCLSLDHNQENQNVEIDSEQGEDNDSVYKLQEQSKFGLSQNMKNPSSPQLQEQKKSIILSSQQFICYLWKKINKIFSQYEVNKNMGISYQHSIQIISQLTTNNDSIVLISQGLNKLSSNSKKLIKFKKFAGFVLHSLGQMSLKQFNKTQVKGKFQINQTQLSTLLKLAFGLICDENQINFYQIGSLIFKQQNQKSKKVKPNYTYCDYMMWLCQKVGNFKNIE